MRLMTLEITDQRVIHGLTIRLLRAASICPSFCSLWLKSNKWFASIADIGEAKSTRHWFATIKSPSSAGRGKLTRNDWTASVRRFTISWRNPPSENTENPNVILVSLIPNISARSCASNNDADFSWNHRSDNLFPVFFSKIHNLALTPGTCGFKCLQITIWFLSLLKNPYPYRLSKFWWLLFSYLERVGFPIVYWLSTIGTPDTRFGICGFVCSRAWWAIWIPRWIRFCTMWCHENSVACWNVFFVGVGFCLQATNILFKVVTFDWCSSWLRKCFFSS